jgi:hypothetical protein
MVPTMVEKIAKRYERTSVLLIVHELGKNPPPHLLVDARQFGGKCRQRAAALGVLAEFQT